MVIKGIKGTGRPLIFLSLQVMARDPLKSKCSKSAVFKLTENDSTCESALRYLCTFVMSNKMQTY